MHEHEPHLTSTQHTNDTYFMRAPPHFTILCPPPLPQHDNPHHVSWSTQRSVANPATDALALEQICSRAPSATLRALSGPPFASTEHGDAWKG
mmetsp:Transcript_65097/g.194672  ORF Transcript_65097/g.194672 Transcript_65097/m.194672 type:complete len:93 (+) Transcript_65097:1-279(+)|eukprot:6447914-Prymnesium_polylepis.1